MLLAYGEGFAAALLVISSAAQDADKMWSWTIPLDDVSLRSRPCGRWAETTPGFRSQFISTFQASNFRDQYRLSRAEDSMAEDLMAEFLKEPRDALMTSICLEVNAFR